MLAVTGHTRRFFQKAPYGASGEAGAFQPVRDRSGKGVANRPVVSVAQASVTATAKRTQRSDGVWD